MNDEQIKTEQPNITDPEFEWKSSAHTDVQATWRKHGWKPKAELEAEKQREAA